MTNQSPRLPQTWHGSSLGVGLKAAAHNDAEGEASMGEEVLHSEVGVAVLEDNEHDKGVDTV